MILVNLKNRQLELFGKATVLISIFLKFLIMCCLVVLVSLGYILQSTIGSGLYCLDIILYHAESLVKVLGLLLFLLLYTRCNKFWHAGPTSLVCTATIGVSSGVIRPFQSPLCNHNCL